MVSEETAGIVPAVLWLMGDSHVINCFYRYTAILTFVLAFTLSATLYSDYDIVNYA